VTGAEKFRNFPVIFPDNREFRPETGSRWTASSASYSLTDIANGFVFPVSLFLSRIRLLHLEWAFVPSLIPLGLPGLFRAPGHALIQQAIRR
jgi:hypothetical protein